MSKEISKRIFQSRQEFFVGFVEKLEFLNKSLKKIQKKTWKIFLKYLREVLAEYIFLQIPWQWQHFWRMHAYCPLNRLFFKAFQQTSFKISYDFLTENIFMFLFSGFPCRTALAAQVFIHDIFRISVWIPVDTLPKFIFFGIPHWEPTKIPEFSRGSYSISFQNFFHRYSR